MSGNPLLHSNSAAKFQHSNGNYIVHNQLLGKAIISKYVGITKRKALHNLTY